MDAAAVVVDAAAAADERDSRARDATTPKLPAPVEADVQRRARTAYRAASRIASRAQDYGPPAGYTPIILPGESISKYRNLAQPAAEPQPASSIDDACRSGRSGGRLPSAGMLMSQLHEEIEEEAAHLDQGFTDAEAEPEPVRQRSKPLLSSRSRNLAPERGFWRSRRKPAAAVESEAAAVVAPDEAAVSHEEAASPLKRRGIWKFPFPRSRSRRESRGHCRARESPSPRVIEAEVADRNPSLTMSAYPATAEVVS